MFGQIKYGNWNKRFSIDIKTKQVVCKSHKLCKTYYKQTSRKNWKRHGGEQRNKKDIIEKRNVM